MGKFIFYTFLLLLCYSTSIVAKEIDLKKYSSTINFYGQHFVWGSDWGGSLDIILRDNLYFDKSSSQPKGFLSKLYDGNPGNINNPTGSFLIFDKQIAAFRVIVPKWRYVDNLSVYVLEKKSFSKASFVLIFENSNGRKQRIKMSKKVVSSKQNIAHVKYESDPLAKQLSNGTFFLKYNNPDFGSAFVSEVVIDGLGNQVENENLRKKGKLKWGDKTDKNQGISSQINSWIKLTFNKILKSHSDNPVIMKKNDYPSLLFWKQHSFGYKGNATLHSLIFRTENSGNHHTDLAPVWLAYPSNKSNKKIPLIILVSDHNLPESSLELLGFSGRPEFNLTTQLLDDGFSVLVVSPIHKYRTIKENEHEQRMQKVINKILGVKFLNHANLNIDLNNIGIWGYGDAAKMALKISSKNKIIKANGLSRIDMICCSGAKEKLSRSKLIEIIGKMKTIIFENESNIKKWKELNPNQNIKFIEAKYNIITQKEKQKLSEFMTAALNSK